MNQLPSRHRSPAANHLNSSPNPELDQEPVTAEPELPSELERPQRADGASPPLPLWQDAS